MIISLARDAALCFIYDNTLIRLYALGYKLRFFSLLDNECPEPNASVVVLPGGYPELYASKLIKATKFLVFLKRRFKTAVYAEGGGYIALAQLLLKKNDCWLMLGAFKIVGYITAPTLACYKYCVAFGSKRGVFAGHEFRYYAELSKAGQKHVYLVKAYDALKLEGISANNVFGGHTHCIGLLKQ
ncbi:MAG: hypothetical protein AAI946_00370 [Candidatus Hodgkinia cicadicola]